MQGFRRRPNLLMGFTLIIASVFLAQALSMAAEHMDKTRLTYAIQAQSLKSALEMYQETSNLNIAYSDDLVEGKMTDGVSGKTTPAQALKRILTGTGITYTVTSKGTVILKEARTKATPKGEGTEKKQEVRKSVEMEQMVVTATKEERTVKDTPASVTVITAEEIARSGAKTLTDLLKMVPGVYIDDKYGDGTNSGAVFRGHVHLEHAGYTMVLVDGMPILDIYGGVDYGGIPLSNIERIEVVKGPGSALWGAFAVGGTINIITKKPSLKPVVNLSSKIGENEMVHHSFYGQFMGEEGWRKGLGIALSGESKKSDGWRENTQYDNENIWLKVSKDIEGWDAYVDLAISTSDRECGRPGTIDQKMWDKDELDKAKTEEKKHDRVLTQGYDLYTLTFKKQITDSQAISADLSYMDQDYDYLTGKTFKFADTRTLSGGLLYKIGFGSHSFNLGVDLVTGDVDTDKHRRTDCYEVDWDSLKSRRYLKVDSKKTGIYAQDSWKVTESLEAIVALRWDRVEYDSEGYQYNSAGTTRTDIDKTSKFEGWSPRGALVYKVNANANVYGSIGKSFKIPSENTLFTCTYANPDLDAIESLTYEIGTKYSSAKISGSLSVYLEETENLIQKDEEKKLYVSTGDTEHKGVEAELAYRITENLTAKLTADYVRAKVKKSEDKEIEGKYLKRVPEYKIGLGLDYAHDSGFFASFAGTEVGSSYTDGINEHKYGGYFVCDARLGYEKELGKSDVRWTLGVDNLFDKKYSTYVSYYSNTTNYYPAMPRTFFTELRISF